MGLAEQQAGNHIGFMCGTDCDAGSHQPVPVSRFADTVATQIKIGHDLTCDDCVAAVKTSHTGCGYELFVRKMGENPIDQHRFGFRPVKCFTNNRGIAKKFQQIVFCDAYTVGPDIQIRVDF